MLPKPIEVEPLLVLDTVSCSTPAPASPSISAKSLQAANVPPPTSAAPAAMTPMVISTVLRFIPNLLGCGASEGGRFLHSLLAGQGDHTSTTNLRSAPPLRVGVVRYKGSPQIGNCQI